MPNFKKSKKLFLLIVFLAIVTLLLGANFLRSPEILSTGTELKLKALTDIDLSDISIANTSALGESKTEAEILANKAKKELRISGENFTIYGFSSKEGVDKYGGGGCEVTIFENYIEIDGKYYTANPDNLYQTIKPTSKELFSKLINLSWILNPSFCGQSLLIYDGPMKYQPKFDDMSCKTPKVNLDSNYSENNGIYEFSYFIEDIVQPYTLIKITLKYDGTTLSSSSSKVFECKDDGIMF